MSARLRTLLFSLILAATALPAFAQAQLGTGAIAGVVIDSSEAVVSGARVVVTNADTGQTRASKTSGGGQFSAGVLPPGRYSIRVEQAGFAPHVEDGLDVTVGATVTLRLILRPAGVEETVAVVAERAALDASKTDQSTLIDRKQINDLPINGRRADQFALLTPGVTRDGRFGLLSYRGQSGVFNNFTLEGNDDNQAYFSEARGRTRIASSISANAIREFSVAQSGFMPEFGRSAGGGINAVVRSGTNAFGGDAFWYFRNEKMGEIDPLASIKPPETRQQFGGSIAGPLRKNKVFYFANVDQQLRNAPLLIEDLSGVLTTGLPANASAADTAAFNAGVADLKSRFPDGGPGHAMPRTFNQTLLLAKIDATLNNSNTLSITHNYLRAHGVAAIQTPLVLGNVGRNGTDDVRINSFNVRLTSLTSPRSVNELRVQVGRDFEFEFADQPPPQVFVGGFSFGRATFLERPALPDERKLQFVDNWSLVAGRHSFKAGTDIVRAKDIIDNPAQFGGAYTYSNALTYGRDLLNPAGKNYSSYVQNFGLVGTTFSTTDVALFGQDTWRPLKGLVVNYGVRYDYQQNPKPTAPNPAIPETMSINSWKGGVGPRIGAAYDITGDGRTILRGAWGVYYGRTSNGMIQNALVQTGLTDLTLNTISLTVRSTDAFAVSYPNTLSAFPASAVGAVTAFRLDPAFMPPRMRDFNVGIERQLSKTLTLSVSGIYTHGDRLPASFDTNLPAPTFTRRYVFPDGQTVDLPYAAGVTRTAAGVSQSVNLSRPNPAFGALTVVKAIGETWYKAMFVELKKRYANGYQFGIAYTLAKAENIGGNGDGGGSGAESPFGGSGLQDQFNLESDRGIAPTDQRHRFVANAIATLPLGFRVSGIFSAETGRPYSQGVSVPSLPFTLNGAQYVGFGGLFGQGSSGNVAPGTIRNSVYGDANYRLDMRLSRDFRLPGHAVLEALVEGFNVFNRDNYNGFRSTRYDATATTVTTPLSQPVVLVERSDFGVANNDGSSPDGTNARRFQIAFRVRF